MRINPISNQNFKAIQINESSEFSKEQTNIAEMIFTKAHLPQENYNGRSIVQMLEQDYAMDIYAEANSDKESVNLYFAEKSYLNGELANLPKLTPIGIYNNDYPYFDITEIENSLIELEQGQGKNFIGSIATVAMAIGVMLIAALSIFNIAKNKNLNKTIETVSTVKNIAADSSNKVQNDTIKFFDAIKK